MTIAPMPAGQADMRPLSAACSAGATASAAEAAASAAGAASPGVRWARAVPRSVTGRALTVLEAFEPGHTELTVSEIARRTGLPLTTAHRLVGDLTEWGALERDDLGRYRIGLRLWEAASLAPRGLGLRELAMPFLEDLYEVTHENVQLAVRSDHEVIFVERIAGRHSVGVLTRVGGRFPAHATGVGLVLLAYAPPEVQEAVLAGPLRRFTEKTITDPVLLRRMLAEVRRTGFAVSDRQVTMDARSVAAPVVDRAGAVVAALSLVVRASGARPRDPIDEVVSSGRWSRANSKVRLPEPYTPASTSYLSMAPAGALGPAVRTAARGISRALASGSPTHRQPDWPPQDPPANPRVHPPADDR